MAKRPRKPKLSSGIKVWENYDKRMTSFESDKKKKERLIDKYR